VAFIRSFTPASQLSNADNSDDLSFVDVECSITEECCVLLRDLWFWKFDDFIGVVITGS
jgi:hypothetical protein